MPREGQVDVLQVRPRHGELLYAHRLDAVGQLLVVLTVKRLQVPALPVTSVGDLELVAM